MDVPTFSIIIPAYNAERYLNDTVQSVIAQTRADWETVIVDDGSLDTTSTIAAKLTRTDSRIRTITTVNGGANAARNAGLLATTPSSSFIAFLDSDDIWEPDALARLSAGHDARPDSLLTFGEARYIGPDNEDLPNERPNHLPKRMTFAAQAIVSESDDKEISFETLLLGNLIQTPGCVLLPRTTLATLGGFDPRIRQSEDWHYWLRASLRGAVNHIQSTVLAYRVHPSGQSRNHERMLDQAALALKTIATEEYLTPIRMWEVSMVYAIRHGIGVANVDEWTAALKDIEHAMRSGRVTSKSDKDIADINGALLMALNGNVDLASRLDTRGSDRQVALTPEEVVLTRAARKRLLVQSTWIKSRLAVHALRRHELPRAFSHATSCAVDCLRSIGL